MKKFVIGCIILNTLAITSTYAQNDNRKSEEKIILQDNKPSNEVEIEIRDGNVYVDGKKVAPYALNRNLKIIYNYYLSQMHKKIFILFASIRELRTTIIKHILF